MNDQDSGLVSSVLAVSALGVVFVALAVVLHAYTGSEFGLGLLGLAVAIVTAAAQYKSAKDNESRARLFSQKQAVYSALINLVMNQFSQFEEGKFSPKDLVKRLQEVRKDLIIWGSFQTIQTFDSFPQLSDADSAEANAAKGINWISRLFSSIRSDLGHNDPSEAAQEIALGVLKAPDREMVRSHVKNINL